MSTLYMSIDKAAVTHRSLSATCSFITDIALGMTRVVEGMLPESAEDQYGQLRLLIHGLKGIEEAAIDITPDVLLEEKDGEV